MNKSVACTRFGAECFPIQKGTGIVFRMIRRITHLRGFLIGEMLWEN